jgi:Putative peptidoglycan binding domain
MAWRLAKSLETMREQFNAHAPNRKKTSDGTIGDAAHASRDSDHNPWIQDGANGVVSALDITHDPGNGVDTWAIAEYLRQQKDGRIKYVISNKRIFSSTTSPWTWRTYTGSNPHSTHMHVSVRSTKSHYDDTSPWALFGGGAGQRPVLRKGASGIYVRELQTLLAISADGIFGGGTEKAVRDFQVVYGLAVDGVVGPATWAALDKIPEIGGDPDSPSNRPILRKGSKGEHVRTVQRLLELDVDGHFGAITEAGVKGLQRGAGLLVDGIVGPMTWHVLDQFEQTPTDRDWQRGIVCTVFGGKADPNKSAYEDRWIDDDEHGLALPFRFKGDRPQVDVVNRATGKLVTCDVVDVGPWNTNDPYWETGKRPQAESGKDMSGRPTNLAGIDLTPGAARAIGLDGKGTVDWAFAGEQDEGE